MKTYSEEELKEILIKHKMWLNNEEDGEKADLRSANLSYADLRYANLSYANLSYANLSSADLSYADLRSANLRSANLSSANLSYADLRSANLSYANLRSANLSSADLSYADLSYANLSSADLSYALSDLKFISLTCIGSRKGMTTYCFDYDIVWCGCFKGTLEEFEKKVEETHKDNQQYLKEYRGAIAYIKSLK